MALAVNNPNGQLADGRQKDRIENYTKFWNKDISKEDETGTENRVDSYTDVVNGASCSERH
jgi:sterol 24-C-methyltransferase